MDLETTGALSTVKGLLQESEGLGSETQSESRVKGEEPIDRARKRPLGEEPSKSQIGDKWFTGQKLSDIYVLELFAGTARLTRSFKRKGFKGLAFDKSSKRAEGQNVLEFDVSNLEEVNSLLRFIKARAKQIALVHMAPPCGTASRARGKRLRFLKALNIKEPKPLRDDHHPDGYPWLKGTDKLRTEAANLLYETTVLIAQVAIECNIAITIENPANSLMWKTSPFKSLFHSFPQLKYITFHNCAHGGSRDKLTCFATNVNWFDALELRCDKQHSHAPWTPSVINGKVHYPTHSEAAYPELLCERMASIVLAIVLAAGAVVTDDVPKHAQLHGKTLNRVVLGALPRGKHVKPLVSEFGTYINVVINAQCDNFLQPFMETLPKGSSVQSRSVLTWGEVRDSIERQVKKHELSKKLDAIKMQNGQQIDETMDEFSYAHVFAELGCIRNSNFKVLMDAERAEQDFARDLACEKVVVAIPREPMDFLKRAVEVGHPRSVAISLPEDLKSVVDWNREEPVYNVFKHRIDFVKYWTDRAQKLKSADAELLNKAPVHLRGLLKGKRLALWQEMVDFFDYPDKRLVSDILHGFPITGWMPDSNVFPKEVKEPSLDVDTLQSLSKGMNAHVKAKVLAAGSNEMAAITWAETSKELEEGWMEVDKGPGDNAAWAMRFGLQQKEKVRVIDDFSIAGVNQTTGMNERLKIFGIDDIAVLLAYSLDSNGDKQHPKMLGKTIDLRSAYKQFGICTEDRQRIRVATCEPSASELILLMVNSLPFGATGSVAAFLRISMFLWYVGMAGLKLAWTAFYDDYTLISREDCAKNASWAAECLFDMLGVLFAKEGKKATQFDMRFNSLGVVFDLQCMVDKLVFVGHTESRRTELAESLRDVLEKGECSAKSIERLRGRLLWFENFVCGRQANFLISSLGKYMSESKALVPVGNDLRGVLEKILHRVEASKPVEVSKKILETWILFTDGACESQSSVGGVLISPRGQPVAMFGDTLPSELEEAFYQNSAHPIYEVELLPLFISIFLWGSWVDKSQVVCYLDNDAARSGLIKGSGATKVADAIIQLVCESEAALQLKSWFSRVPSHSNISDEPSRLRFDRLLSLGCRKATIPWMEIASRVSSRLL